jgi:hypothetical protein
MSTHFHSFIRWQPKRPLTVPPVSAILNCMAAIKPYHSAIQLIGAFSRHVALLDWLWAHVETQLGPILARSEAFPFRESQYYQSEMGESLIKQFVVLNPNYDPGTLAATKRMTNDWEETAKQVDSFPEIRPLNVDPGYMTLTKLVLASTKNREHRIYLNEGIYAEVTLAFRNQAWHAMEWTYPDYQRADFQAFFTMAREHIVRP